MASEILLNIGDNGRHQDGDILRVTFTYDAQRLNAETLISGRLPFLRPSAQLDTLRTLYKDITDPNKQPQPTPDDLARWWTECERITPLLRGSFSNFPYSSGERGLMLVVPLDREATMAERAEWTGKTAEATRAGTVPIPKRVDWVADVMPGRRVRRGPSDNDPATVADVRTRRQPIHVLDPISPTVIRSRA